MTFVIKSERLTKVFLCVIPFQKNIVYLLTETYFIAKNQ